MSWFLERKQKEENKAQKDKGRKKYLSSDEESKDSQKEESDSESGESEEEDFFINEKIRKSHESIGSNQLRKRTQRNSPPLKREKAASGMNDCKNSLIYGSCSIQDCRFLHRNPREIRDQKILFDFVAKYEQEILEAQSRGISSAFIEKTYEEYKEDQRQNRRIGERDSHTIGKSQEYYSNGSKRPPPPGGSSRSLYGKPNHLGAQRDSEDIRSIGRNSGKNEEGMPNREMNSSAFQKQEFLANQKAPFNNFSQHSNRMSSFQGGFQPDEAHRNGFVNQNISENQFNRNGYSDYSGAIPGPIGPQGGLVGNMMGGFNEGRNNGGSHLSLGPQWSETGYSSPNGPQMMGMNYSENFYQRPPHFSENSAHNLNQDFQHPDFAFQQPSYYSGNGNGWSGNIDMNLNAQVPMQGLNGFSGFNPSHGQFPIANQFPQHQNSQFYGREGNGPFKNPQRNPPSFYYFQNPSTPHPNDWTKNNLNSKGGGLYGNQSAQSFQTKEAKKAETQKPKKSGLLSELNGDDDSQEAGVQYKESPELHKDDKIREEKEEELAKMSANAISEFLKTKKVIPNLSEDEMAKFLKENKILSALERRNRLKEPNQFERNRGHERKRQKRPEEEQVNSENVEKNEENEASLKMKEINEKFERLRKKTIEQANEKND